MPRLFLPPVAWSALLLAVVGWGVLVVVAPVLGGATRGRPVRAAVAAAAYVTGGLVCHHRPERSFHLAGAQLPVCGRCTGLYVSTAVGVLLACAWARVRRISSRSWLLAAAVPSVLTLAVEWSGAWPVTNGVRAAAAAPVGLVLGALMVEAAAFRGRL